MALALSVKYYDPATTKDLISRNVLVIKCVAGKSVNYENNETIIDLKVSRENRLTFGDDFGKQKFDRFNISEDLHNKKSEERNETKAGKSKEKENKKETDEESDELGKTV